MTGLATGVQLPSRKRNRVPGFHGPQVAVANAKDALDRLRGAAGVATQLCPSKCRMVLTAPTLHRSRGGAPDLELVVPAGGDFPSTSWAGDRARLDA